MRGLPWATEAQSSVERWYGTHLRIVPSEGWGCWALCPPTPTLHWLKDAWGWSHWQFWSLSKLASAAEKVSGWALQLLCGNLSARTRGLLGPDQTVGSVWTGPYLHTDDPQFLAQCQAGSERMHTTWPRDKGLFTCLYPPLGHELLMGVSVSTFSLYSSTQGRPGNQQILTEGLLHEWCK